MAGIRFASRIHARRYGIGIEKAKETTWLPIPYLKSMNDMGGAKNIDDVKAPSKCFYIS